MDRPASFSEIYRLHADAVFRLAWLLSGNRSDAEDLTSEAFARALAGAGRIQHATVRSYLYAIVRNLVASSHRRPVVEVSGDEDVGDAPDTDLGPDERLHLRQRLAHASEGLGALREPERQVLMLAAVHGLSNDEVADALGLRVGNVRVRLHRARKQLMEFLERSANERA
jgi:RNA polymerase sigma-70 factor (ECF subfamily)